MEHPMKSKKLEARRCSAILLTFVMAVYSSLLAAHADHDKARFVSASGVDSGKCDAKSSARCTTQIWGYIGQGQDFSRVGLNYS